MNYMGKCAYCKKFEVVKATLYFIIKENGDLEKGKDYEICEKCYKKNEKILNKWNFSKLKEENESIF